MRTDRSENCNSNSGGNDDDVGFSPPNCMDARASLAAAAACHVQELYVLMRIHHVLCERLGKAVTLSEAAKELKADQVQPSLPVMLFLLFTR